jgi:LysR family transcriptional regulator, transcriptional activator of nhaA
MRSINFQHLIYFREVALQGSVTKASERLRIAQPALSIQLKQFEESLGTQLFRREGKKMILTPMGYEVLRLAHQVHQSGQDLSALKEESFIVRHLKFGVLDNVPKNLVADVAMSLRASSKAVVSILEGEQDRLLRELLSGAIEFVVTERPITQFAGKQLSSSSLVKKTLCAFATDEYKHLKTNFPKSLNLQNIILPTEHSKLRGDLENYFANYTIQPRVSFESQDTMVQKMMAVRGQGVVFLPYLENEIATLFSQLNLIAEIPEIKCEFFLIHRSENEEIIKLVNKLAKD